MANDSEGKNNLLRAERDTALAELAAVKARAERAEAALRKAGHAKHCESRLFVFGRCTCGLDTALAPASAQEGGKHAPLQPSACAGRAEGARP